jgi:hypothetical protein
MTSRILWWGLLGGTLAFAQVVPPPKTDQTLGERLADLSRRLESAHDKPERLLVAPVPKVCAAPLLVIKPNIQSRMPVIKPRPPLPRMPQIVPPAPPCPDHGFTERGQTR